MERQPEVGSHARSARAACTMLAIAACFAAGAASRRDCRRRVRGPEQRRHRSSSSRAAPPAAGTAAAPGAAVVGPGEVARRPHRPARLFSSPTFKWFAFKGRRD